MDNIESLGCPTNVLNNSVDQSRGQFNASSILNGGRTGDVGHGDGVGASRGAAGNVEVTGCFGNHSDAAPSMC